MKVFQSYSSDFNWFIVHWFYIEWVFNYDYNYENSTNYNKSKSIVKCQNNKQQLYKTINKNRIKLLTIKRKQLHNQRQWLKQMILRTHNKKSNKVSKRTSNSAKSSNLSTPTTKNALNRTHKNVKSTKQKETIYSNKVNTVMHWCNINKH